MGSYLNACFLSAPVFSRRRITHFSSAGGRACVVISLFCISVLAGPSCWVFFFFLHDCALLLGAVMDPPSRTSDILYYLETRRRAPTEVREQTLP